MNFHIAKALKVVQLTLSLTRTWVGEKLAEKQWYRRFKGGTWYFVYLFETDEEFWTQIDYPTWCAVVIEKEQYEV
jgi:hypothetical protein